MPGIVDVRLKLHVNKTSVSATFLDSGTHASSTKTANQTTKVLQNGVSLSGDTQRWNTKDSVAG